MRLRRALGFLTGTFLLLSAPCVRGQSWGRPRIPAQGACFYKDSDFRGEYFCAPVGTTTARLPRGVEDEISSIQILGDAEVTLFQHPDFQGQTRTVTASVNSLKSMGFNDRASAFRVDSRGHWQGSKGNSDGSNQWVWGRPQTPARGACFYKDSNFRGEYFCAPTGTESPEMPGGLEDEISSIQIFGNSQVTLFQHPNYQGRTRTVDDSVSSLKSMGFNDKISAFRVDNLGQGPGSRGGPHGTNPWSWGRPQTPSKGACFFKDFDFRGESFCAPLGTQTARLPRGVEDEISSIQIFGNVEVTLFQHPNFQGQTRTITSSINSLKSMGFNDRASSFRVDNRGSGPR